MSRLLVAIVTVDSVYRPALVTLNGMEFMKLSCQICSDVWSHPIVLCIYLKYFYPYGRIVSFDLMRTVWKCLSYSKLSVDDLTIACTLSQPKTH